MTGTNVRTALVAAFASMSGLPVIWQNQNAPRPGRAYVSLQLTMAEELGFPYEGPVDGETGIRDLSFDEEFTINVMIYGDNATFPEDISFSIRKRLRRKATRLAFEAAGFCYIESMMVRDVPSLKGPEFEPRSTMALLFRTNSQEPDEVGVIETVVIEGEYHNVFPGIYLSFTDQSLMIFNDGALFLLSDGSPQRTPIITSTVTVQGAS